MQDGTVLFARTEVSPSPSHLVRPCRIWQGYIGAKGYGLFTMNGSRDYAHRQSYRWFVGPIAEGLQIDHLCRHRACVEPTHLEPVTPKVNSERGMKATQTHCVRGHAYSESNTYLAGNGTRKCRVCRALRSRARARTA